LAAPFFVKVHARRAAQVRIVRYRAISQPKLLLLRTSLQQHDLLITVIAKPNSSHNLAQPNATLEESSCRQ
jgi:hypothetical protein